MTKILHWVMVQAFILLLSSVPLSAVEFHVNKDGTGDFTVIQDAIDAAAGGDIITVHSGTYYENVQFNGKNITLRSTDPEDEGVVASTVIDGQQADSVVRFRGMENETCLLSGFTITNGAREEGGGIMGGSTPIGTHARITNCIIKNNNATGAWWPHGGGLYRCSGLIANCVIIGNEAIESLSGGSSGGGLSSCNGEIINCTISNNSAEEGGGLFDCDALIDSCSIRSNTGIEGGGLNGCDGTIINCTISQNSVGWNGGGLSGCGGLIADCTISGNFSWGGGGLYWCYGIVERCTITDNEVGLDGSGGGLGLCRGITITNCTISGNSCFSQGGGLSSCEGTIKDCTISDNSSRSYGGGLYSFSGMIENCIVANNSSRFWGGGMSSCHGPIIGCVISGNSALKGGGLSDCGSITNCTVSDNSANYDGGGLYSCDALTNCVVSGNSASLGGGLYDCGGYYLPIINCTISGNIAEEDGGGIYDCEDTITNCIVWGNEAGRDGDQVFDCDRALIIYSCIQEWAGGGEGNISDDPLFVTGPLGDYYLSCEGAGQGDNSPCIDAGSDTAEALGLDTLTTRTDCGPDTDIVDMGYHYPMPLGEGPVIECSLNADEFWPGDQLVATYSIDNSGPDVTVDVYFAFVMPTIPFS